MGNKKPAHTFTSVIFPDCASNCAAVKHFGCGECESVCPWKFDDKGNPVNKEELTNRLNIWI